MEPPQIRTEPPEFKKKSGIGKFLLILLIVAIGASALTYFIVTQYIFPRQFTPVQLTEKEKVVLDAKIDRLDPTKRVSIISNPIPSQSEASEPHSSEAMPQGQTQPERYSEAGANREITFTTREINALLANNKDLAQKLAIDFSENMASAKLLIPLDPDFPLLGGKTLKVTAGLELRYAGTKPVISLKGVSVWGVPIPNAWLGGIKNVDLVSEFGLEKGFWSTFAAGVENISVSDGRLTLKLRE
jgi:hypothetical protein